MVAGWYCAVGILLRWAQRATTLVVFLRRSLLVKCVVNTGGGLGCPSAGPAVRLWQPTRGVESLELSREGEAGGGGGGGSHSHLPPSQHSLVSLARDYANISTVTTTTTICNTSYHPVTLSHSHTPLTNILSFLIHLRMVCSGANV